MRTPDIKHLKKQFQKEAEARRVELDSMEWAAAFWRRYQRVREWKSEAEWKEMVGKWVDRIKAQSGTMFEKKPHQVAQRHPTFEETCRVG